MSADVVLTFAGLVLAGPVPGFLLARFGLVWLAVGLVVLALAVTGVFGVMAAKTNSRDSLSYFVLSGIGELVTVSMAIGCALGAWLRRRAKG